MRTIKILLASLLLAFPALVTAAAADVPGDSTWYLHIDFKKMKSEQAGKAIYDWLRDEAFKDVMEESGVDLDKELDQLTAFAHAGSGPVILFEGNISQETRDKTMTLVAAGGNLDTFKSSGKTYYHFSGQSGDEEEDGKLSYKDSNVDISIDALEENAWISTALKNMIVITASEEQMQSLLANNGKVAGSRGHSGALVVLTAEKTLLQAGMNSAALDDDDDDSGWNSNILRNTKQVAFLVAAAADQLAIEAKLITTEPDMTESLASVVRGLISLSAFNDDLDAGAVAMLQGTKVKADGNTLSISLAIDPDVVIAALSD